MAGLVAAKLQGRMGGKPKGLSIDAQKQARVAESLYKEGYAINLIDEQLNMPRTTVYKYLEHRSVQIERAH